jgi:hypothetical protein
VPLELNLSSVQIKYVLSSPAQSPSDNYFTFEVKTFPSDSFTSDESDSEDFLDESDCSRGLSSCGIGLSDHDTCYDIGDTSKHSTTNDIEYPEDILTESAGSTRYTLDHFHNCAIPQTNDVSENDNEYSILFQQSDDTRGHFNISSQSEGLGSFISNSKSPLISHLTSPSFVGEDNSEAIQKSMSPFPEVNVPSESMPGLNEVSKPVFWNPQGMAVDKLGILTECGSKIVGIRHDAIDEQVSSCYPLGNCDSIESSV